MSTQGKLGSKQAYRVIHQPVSVVSQCGADAWLKGWLAEINSALQASSRRALNKSTVYCTLSTLRYCVAQQGKPPPKRLTNSNRFVIYMTSYMTCAPMVFVVIMIRDY